MKNGKFIFQRRQILFVLYLLFTVQFIQAQELVVSGLVTDQNKEPLIGAAVTVKGTSTGTITDLDGNYSLKVSSPDGVLVFSYIGFTPQEIPIKGRQVINATLGEDVKALDEVVVVGYGVQKKSHLTGSVTKVETDGLSDIPATRIDQALQGKIAGVQISNTTSEVGVAPQIRVRGMGSISASSEPLVVVDGFPVADGLAFVDMNDVASIEVLKDAASSAIYGSRGANGAILITTKNGSADKPKYSFKSSWGVRSAYKTPDTYTSKEYIQLLTRDKYLQKITSNPSFALTNSQEVDINKLLNNNSAISYIPSIFTSNDYTSLLSPKDEALLYIDNETDWQDLALRNAFSQNYQFGISGGKNTTKYYISANYSDTEGIMNFSEYRKMGFRAKIDTELNKRVSVGININPSYSKRERPSVNFTDYVKCYSFLPYRHTEATAALTGQEVGSYAHPYHFNTTYTRPDGTTFTTNPWTSKNNNPLSTAERYRRYQSDYRLQSSAYIDIKILDGLTFRSSNGIYVAYNQKDEYMEFDAKKAGETNQGVYGNKLFIDMLSENTFNYNKTIGNHDLSVLLGYTAEKTTTTTAGITGTAFPTDYIKTLNAATSITLGPDKTYTFKEEDALMSVLGRINYAYADKYLASVSARTDGSSKFAKGNRWGWFPSVSLGWRISEEPFLKKYEWLNSLKLRASWGLTGNNDIANYSFMNKLASANYSFGSNNGTVTAGLANSTSVIANRNITWEQSSEYNYGFDLSVLNNRINLSGEYYYSETIQMLYQQTALSFTGFQKYWNNIGKVANKGFEFELRTLNLKKKDFEWESSFNISLNKNELLDLAGEVRQINQGERDESYLAEVGSPSIQYYLYKTIGVWNSQEEIDANPHHPNDKPGGLRVLDDDKNGKITDADRVVCGTPFPDFTWGFTNTFNLYGFDINILLQGTHGGKIFNGDINYNETWKFNKKFNNSNNWISETYKGDGITPSTNPNTGLKPALTDYALEDASFWSVKDIVIGYKFPKSISKKLGLNGLRLYASAQNLYVHFASNYRGINPEARYTSGDYSNPLISGYQRGAFPMERSFNFGIDINF